jgi:penicillin-binding protein 1A
VADNNGNAQLAQLPSAQSALVALDPLDGAVVSLVGGFDFHRNSFNRAVQARRQPGSGFKPFIYSAALDFGLTPATIKLNAPLVIDCSGDEECWNPENSGGGDAGPTRLREALVNSLNRVSARVLMEIGVDTAIEHAGKFGFRKESLPRNLTLALGTQSASPLEMVTGYATFANGGFKVDWYFISRIEDSTGKVVFEAKPKIACVECERSLAVAADHVETVNAGTELPTSTEALTPQDSDALANLMPPPHIRDVEAPEPLRSLATNQGGLGYLSGERLAPRVISPQNAWLMSDILHDVTVRGTARRSRELGRDDLAGKTGTTNSYRDNWFNGFNTHIVASVWVGFDDEKTLGNTEEGSKTALPIWMLYMKEALKGVPESRMERPGGLIDLRISKTTGLLADQNDPNAVYETFMIEHQPKAPEGGVPGTSGGRGSVEPMF